jgi:hypothetical protein
MGEIVVRLRAAGETVWDEDLARVSPLAYTHILSNGTYVFDRSRPRGNIALDTQPSRAFHKTAALMAVWVTWLQH